MENERKEEEIDEEFPSNSLHEYWIFPEKRYWYTEVVVIGYDRTLREHPYS